MRLKLLLLLVLVLSTVFLGVKSIRDKGSKSAEPSSNVVVKRQDNSDKSLEIQAWIYPGSPSCDAMSEIADGRDIDVLKAEYFDIDDSGAIVLLTEEEHGCNGFSVKNVDLIKQYSDYQFVVVSANHLDMRAMFSDGTKMTKAIDTIIGFLSRHELSGVEIDFEDFSSWTKNDYANYMKFVGDLATQAKTLGKLTIIDGPPITKNTQHNYLWNYEELAKLPIDFLLIMAYDYQYDEGKGTAIAPNNWVKENVEYVLGQVSVDRIIVGVPSYGYHSNSKNQIILDTQKQSLKYEGVEKAKISNDSFEYGWWNKNDYYAMQKSDGLSKKINFIKSLGIKNISVWHLGGNPWFK